MGIREVLNLDIWLPPMPHMRGRVTITKAPDVTPLGRMIVGLIIIVVLCWPLALAGWVLAAAGVESGWIQLLVGMPFEIVWLMIVARWATR
jgi:hypothetical protein